jgi:hypothetical protein
MMDYLPQLEQVASTIEAARGPFTLFGLFMREDAPGRWELVAAAPWLEEGKLASLGKLVEALSNELGQEALLSFSRIVTLKHDDSALRAIMREAKSQGLPLSRQGRHLFGLPIEDAYILRAAKPPGKRPQSTRAKRRVQAKAGSARG